MCIIWQNSDTYGQSDAMKTHQSPPSQIPELVVATDVSGNGSLQMMIPFVSLNPNIAITQSVADPMPNKSQQFPMFSMDLDVFTPQRRPFRPLLHQISESNSDSDKVHVDSISANAPRKKKRSFEYNSVQMTDEKALSSESHSSPLKRPLNAKGIVKIQSYELVLESSLVTSKSDKEEAIFKCSRDDGVRINHVIKAKKSINFNSMENPFKLEDYQNGVKKFILCKDCRPWNVPSRYRKIKETDDPVTYPNYRKSHENRPPKISSVLFTILPSILRFKLNKNHNVLADFSEGHREIIEKIIALIHCNGSRWEGIYMLLPWPNMISTRYCLDTKKPISPSLYFVEIHRRIMKMEDTCAELVKFLSKTIGSARKVLRRIASKHLEDAHAVLKYEIGWENVELSETSQSAATEDSSEVTPVAESNAEIAQYISKIIPSVSTDLSPMAEKCKWLKENRR